MHIQKDKGVETRKVSVEVSLEESELLLNLVRIKVHEMPELTYTIIKESKRKNEGKLVVIEYNALMNSKYNVKLSLFIYNRILKAVSVDNKSSVWIFSSK